MKKLIILLLAAALMLSLCGCACEHQWREASCTEPKTCEKCGEIEGEPLDHEMTAANFQSPATCAKCGYTEGEPLTADFDTYGISVSTPEVGVIYPYTTTVYDSKEVFTTGQVQVTSYKVIESDETHEAKDGFVWHLIEMKASFSDNNAYNRGVMDGGNFEDYYDIKLHDDTVVHSDDGSSTFLVNYNGEDYQCHYVSRYEWGQWQYDIGVTLTQGYDICVPAGYDGTVVGFRNSAIEWTEGMYIFDVYEGNEENFLLFRLNGQPE